MTEGLFSSPPLPVRVMANPHTDSRALAAGLSASESEGPTERPHYAIARTISLMIGFLIYASIAGWRGPDLVPHRHKSSSKPRFQVRHWIAVLSIFVCSSAYAQSAPPDPIAVIRAQIMQHWFPAPQVNLHYTVSFNLDRDGRIIGQPVVAATSYDQGRSAEALYYAVLGAQPFLLLRQEDYESWKHVTTSFTRTDKTFTDIYAFTKRDILGVATGMSAAAAKAAMLETGCSVSLPKPTILECTNNNGNQLVARLTENMSPNVVTAISYVFQSGAPAQEVIGMVSAQFHTRPFNQVWHLSNSSTMELAPVSSEPRSANSLIPSWVLIISEPRLLDQDQDALLEKQRDAVPPPKF